jgi:hypothetical protein
LNKSAKSKNAHSFVTWDILKINKSDYPEVAAEKDLEYFKENCPDPNGILDYKLLN